MRDWYALQIRPNHEATITEQLSLAGIESYYPAREHPSKRATRPLPLFPGYLFARFEFEYERIPVIRTPHVFRIVGDEGSVISDAEIAAIRQLVQAKVGLFVHYSWEPGRRARIEYGPLAGFEGVIIRHAGRERILLSVEMINRAISAEVEAEWLHPVGKAA